MFKYNPTKAAEKYAKDKIGLRERFESGVISFLTKQKEKSSLLTIAIDALQVSKSDVETSIEEARNVLKQEK
tara:strand:- start:395 stop:610 length:216 start_codon:yes stop_codon:yes gene_type:complete